MRHFHLAAYPRARHVREHAGKTRGRYVRELFISVFWVAGQIDLLVVHLMEPFSKQNSR